MNYLVTFYNKMRWSSSWIPYRSWKKFVSELDHTEKIPNGFWVSSALKISVYIKNIFYWFGIDMLLIRKNNFWSIIIMFQNICNFCDM